MKDNKENEKEVMNNQINENQEESTVTSNVTPVDSNLFDKSYTYNVKTKLKLSIMF